MWQQRHGEDQKLCKLYGPGTSDLIHKGLLECVESAEDKGNDRTGLVG